MTTSCFPWEKKPSFPWDKPTSTDFRADTSIPVKFGAPQPDFPPAKPLALGVPSSRPIAEIEKPSFPWEKKASSLGKRSNHVDPVEFKISAPLGELPKAEYKFPWEKQPALQPKEEEKKPKVELEEKVVVKEEKSEEVVQTSLEVVKSKEKANPKVKEKGAASPKSTRNQRYKAKEESKKSESSKEVEEEKKEEKVEDEKGKNVEEEIKAEVKISGEVENGPIEEAKTTKEETILDPEVQEKVREIIDKSPKTSPVSRSSSRSSVRKMCKAPSQSSVFTKGPITSPPKHINKKSEKLSKNYKSHCAKPKVVAKPPVVGKEGDQGPKKLSLRTAAYISNWIPAAPEAAGVTTWGPADQRAEEYGNGLGPGVTVAKPSPSTTSLSSSANIRDAVFMEWVEKKKVKRVTKMDPDPVLVLVNPEEYGVPNAESVRQATFDDWYRKRATAQDKQIIKSLEEEENRQKMIREREEEKKKKALATRKAWEANDENRKKLIKCKKREEKEKEKKLQEEKDEKLKNADKTYSVWKERKDERSKGEVKKRVTEEKECKKEQVMEKENKLTDAEKTFKAWKEAKDKETKAKASEQKRIKEQKELELQSEKYKKEKERKEKVKDWEERKERERSEINIPQHVSPWKAAANTSNEPSRDDKLMTNLKYKKMKEKMKSKAEKPVEMVG